MNLLFKKTRMLSENIEEAHLIYMANQDFYQLFKKTNNDIYKDIIVMIKDDRTEMFCTRSVFLDDRLIGIISFYDANEILPRQMFGLSYLQSDSTVTNKTIQDFSADLPDIDEKSMYLSRICITKEEQGKGYSTDLLKYYENISLENNYSCLSLHVHKNNKIALKIYEKYGFNVNCSTNKYLKLLKIL